LLDFTSKTPYGFLDIGRRHIARHEPLQHRSGGVLRIGRFAKP
jgi:hypothetical protein